ncbi:30S ribosomal protein S16 [Candidatus Daviesbacteria bacterium RIFCSPLOWO2_02_FULL_38_15]|nr:MAG: 30S ribosomal protein S16 [Candidatus Daviesbacteria bacterium RIFCSPLOWO2_02_FULL_38_15]
MRIGGRQNPFYRVVAVDERAKRTGGYIELLGTYNPLTEPKDIKLKQDRIDYWIKQGAQPSVGYLRIIGKAPQRPPRKPKKEKPSDKTTKEAQTEQATPSTTETAPTEPAATEPQPDKQPADEESQDSKSTDSSPAKRRDQNDKTKEETKDEGSA